MKAGSDAMVALWARNKFGWDRPGRRNMVIALAAIPRPVREIATLIINPSDGRPIDEELVSIVFADEISQA
jgi:hypothetical protein